MWATVMHNLGVVIAGQGYSGVSYRVGYLAQTRLNMSSTVVPGAIASQLLSSPAILSGTPPAIDSVWTEMARNL